MRTNDLGDKILDSAIDMMMLSFPGVVPADQEAKQAYKSLAADLMLNPTKSLKRVVPRRLRWLRAGD